MSKRISQGELESYLWGAATLLRGTIDAGEYKAFIFPLLFLKRLSDVYDEEFEIALAESDGDRKYAALPEQHRFQVPSGAHWSDIRSTTTDVGKAIARSISATKKTATLELGGKAANLVFEDAAIDEAVEGIVNGIFFNQGHVCCAGSRLILQESIAEEIIEKLKVRMAKIRVGDPLDKNTDLGAINSREQLTKIQELAAIGDAEGAQRWSPQCNLSDKGYWFAPTIFTGVTQAHRIAQEEIFGPVLSVITFRTPQEGIDKANNTPFGLSAGIWSEKGSRTLWASQQLRAGVIWANTFNKFDPTSPFGGYKESGWGREGGKHGLAAYLKTGRESGGK